jgi:CAAX prenyl protease-like protein
MPNRDYWIPMIAFGALTVGESFVSAEWYPAAYIAKAVIVTTILLFCREPLREITFDLRVILPSMLIGLLVFVVWVGLDVVIDYPRLGGRVGFDPYQLLGTSWWPAFTLVRLYGLVLMVPVMEEIFWRSFLLRYLTQHDFRNVPIGTFSAMALWVMVAASAVAHPEWLAAVVAGLAYALWLRRSRSLFGAIVAHVTTNAALGSYVLATRQWQYW